MAVAGQRHHELLTEDAAFFADLPLIPIAASSRVDIVNTDWVAHAIASLHRKPQTDHDTYHLSSGADSPTGEHQKTLLAHQRQRGECAPERRC